MNSFTIKDLENLSGIKAHTIRIWEQRYQFLKPSRTGTNIRFYSNEELKTILNISPNDLIRRYRLQKAATLLSAGHNVSATAYIVGFETPSYFTHCFKEQYGQTPTEFASSKTA